MEKRVLGTVREDGRFVVSRTKTADIKERFKTELLAIFFAGAGVFVLFSLFTFSPGDPSPMTSYSTYALTDIQVKNLCGKWGAWISGLLMMCFGVGSYIVPIFFGFLSKIAHQENGKHEKITQTYLTFFFMALALASLTVFTGLQWKYWSFSGELLLTGGVFGAWLGKILVQEMNHFGASLTSFVVFLATISLAAPFSMVQLLLWCGRKAAWLTKKMAVLALLGTHQLLKKTYELSKLAHQAYVAYAEKRRLLAEEKRKLEEEKLASAPFVEAEVTNADEVSEPNETAPKSSQPPVASEPLSLPDAPMPEVLMASEALFEAQVGVQQELLRDRKRTIFKTLRAKGIASWKLPTVEFLRKAQKADSPVDREKLHQNAQILKQKFLDFGIEGEITAVRPGPVITLYEFKPGPGVKVSRIASLADDLSMALSAESVRILAPLPGKAVVGIEIPSDVRQPVFFREFISHDLFKNSLHQIPIVMGKDIGGQPVFADLARMPHLLCAGQTGAGKSVFMNSLICSLLYRFTPDELRLILVDPKFIEFRGYQDIPHLLLPVVDDAKHASTALKWAVREMERRYRILALMGARNLAQFNQKVDEMGADVVRDLLLSEENQQELDKSASGSDWITAFEPDDTGSPKIGKLPYVVVIIDELADLMMIARKEVEVSIARIAQKARAAGIHLVIATQRPSTDVVTGLIKANLPSRVSFQLASYIDSKTILDRSGAERLLGQGDMLFIPPGVSQLVRLQGAFVDDEEIHKITAFLKSQGKPAYRNEILVSDEDEEEELQESGFGTDPFFDQGVALVREAGHASASFLQRHLKIGYNRAARMIESMESRGIVGPAEGSRPREVLMK